MSEPDFRGPKAKPEDLFGRFREIVSDPLNLLIERVPMAGLVEGDQVYLHNGLKVPGIGPGAYYGPFSSVAHASIAASTSRWKNMSSRNC